MRKTDLLLSALAVSAILPASALADAPKQESPKMQEIHPLFAENVRPAPAKKKALKMRQAAPADWSGRTFKGALIMSNAWADLQITEVPYGIYEFTVGETITEKPLFTYMSANWMSGAPYRGAFYAVRNINMFGALTGVANEVVDLNSYTLVREKFADEPSFGLLPSCMTYDFVSGRIYGAFYNDDLTGLNWVRYDTKALEPDILCSFRNKFNVLAMAASPDGNLYAVNTEGDLYSIDRVTSRATLLGYTGVNVAAYSQALTWDAQSNTLLWAAVTPTGSALYSLDPVNLTATLIKRFSDGEQVSSIWIDDATPMAGAPAQPSLSWQFAAPGSYDGIIGITSPDAGKLTVWLDGEPVKEEENVNAGQLVNVSFSGLSEETHYVSATVRNDAGYSPVGEAFRYVGNDTPKAVTDLVFAEQDGTATLTWNLPETGVEEGYLDPSTVYYKIVRIPDNVEVAGHFTGTTFTEQLPDGVRRYAYRVTPFNGDKQGASTLSNSIIYGQSFEIPYVDNFDSEGCLDTYTILDVDGDGKTWSINTNNGTNLIESDVTYTEGNTANNWLLTPKMKLKAGVMYRYTTHMRNMFNGVPEKIIYGYVAGNESTIDNLHTIGTINVNTPAMTLLDQSVEFSVAADGEYKMALGHEAAYEASYGIFMSQLRVEEIGPLTAPAAVENLTVTPDPAKDPKATVAFTAPTLSLEGTQLFGTLTANIYRDADLKNPMGTVQGVQPGAKAQWVDETNPAPGYHTYTVRMANDSGEGMDVAVTELIGIFTPPFHQDFNSADDLALFQYKPVGFEDDTTFPEMSFGTYPVNSLSVSHFNDSEEDQYIYIVMPQMRFAKESVYKLTFDWNGNYYGDESMRYAVTYGTSPEPEDQTNVAFEFPMNTTYGMEQKEGLIVLPEGGDLYVAIRVKSPGNSYDYVSVGMTNIDIQPEGSALAPSVVTDLVAASELTSKLTMKAPAEDYAGRPLQELTKIEVYRNGGLIPVHTFDNPAPGEDLEWIDEDAVLGFNSYFIVPSNSHGRGNAVTVKSFIGYDQPTAPAGLSIVPSADNQNASISWPAPRRGVNGGVLNEDEMTYTVYQYVPATETEEAKMVPLKSDLKETSYVTEREATDNQELIFYAVAATTPQGTSDPAMLFTILGRPYELPFSESFPDGVAASGLWLNTGNTNYGLQAFPTSEDILAYNGFTGFFSQDGDKGLYLFMNGYNGYGSNVVPFAVLSPKFTLGDCSDPVLSFWTYNYKSGAYDFSPQLNVSASTDEAEFVDLGTVTHEGTGRWERHEFDLASMVGRPGAVILQFVASAGGFQDPILMDNFTVVSRQAGVESVDAAGSSCAAFGLAGAILTRGALGTPVSVFAADGRKVAEWKADDRAHAASPGVYLVKLGGKTFKINVK